MKWWIVIGLLLIFAGYVPQLRTRLRPLWPAVRRMKKHALLVGGARWAIRVEIVRL